MNRFFKKLPGLFAILFITGVLTAVVYPGTVEVEAVAAPPALNGYQLSAKQSRWVKYIAEEVVPLLPGNANERAAMAARVTWWTLREGVLTEGAVRVAKNPIGYSNCGDGSGHIDLAVGCSSGVAWQVGLAAVQVPNPTTSEVISKAKSLHSGMSLKEIIAQVSTLAEYPEGTPQYNAAVNSSGDLQKSLLLRDSATGFYFADIEVRTECLYGPDNRAGYIRGWCLGNSFSRDPGTIVKIIAELTAYYKKSDSGATPPPASADYKECVLAGSGNSTPGADPAATLADEEQKEVPLGLSQQIGKFYSFALGIGALVALGVLIFGGILYTTSAGNASRQDDAKQWLTGSIVGLIILFGSWFILNTVNPELTKLTDLRLLVNKAAEALPSPDGNETGTGGGGGGIGLGSNIFLVNGLPIQVQTPSCYSYNFSQTSFQVAQASCPVSPLATGLNVTDSFCGGRAPGTTGASNVHHGTDIFAVEGSPVYAFEDGTIYKRGWNDIGGNRLWLRGKSGLHYYYAHLKGFAPSTSDGQEVKAGALLGFVGDTGNAKGTGYHLHFEIYPPGPPPYGINAINAKPILDQVCKSVPDGSSTGSLGLAQVLDKPQYSGFGVSFQEIGGKGDSINSSKSFPSASLYKLFVAQWFYDQREKGALNFNQKVPLVSVATNIKENNADGVSFLKTPADPVSISECLPRMIKYSDNICGWALRDYALKKGLDSYLSGQGYSNTSVKGLDTSAQDVAKLLTAIANGRMVSQSASNELYGLMRQQYHQSKIPKGVPSGAEVANKTGELHGSNYSHDAAIIKYNGKNYILVVTTSLDPDVSSTNTVIQQLTRELFNAIKR